MIKINDKYYIFANSNCYSVCKKKIDKNGKNFFSAISYHIKLEDAISFLIQLEEREFVHTHNITLEEAVDNLKKLKNKYIDILSEIRKNEVVDD